MEALKGVLKRKSCLVSALVVDLIPFVQFQVLGPTRAMFLASLRRVQHRDEKVF